MKNIIVYDCDGVLFDSTAAVKGYYDFLFGKCGIPKIDWENPSLVSLAMMGTNEGIIRNFVTDEKLIGEMLEFATNMNFKLFIDLMKPNPNIHDTLEKLQSSGRSLAVFTNRGISLSYLLTHFGMGNFFSYTVTCMDVAKPKPNPEGLYKIMDYFGTEKDALLFIGDSMTDYLAAKAADVHFLAYENRLEDSILIKDHTEVFDYLCVSSFSA
ncbi:HAD family hydrolase [Seleniivibrio woodruffii]|uniref:HAD family hydrolase n=1 Tax=Seleniivibrio woodruffii TaxID=1078050 RepID=UPI002409B63B|nr:HAD family hydrolase [Seleniivibrio woodruffii]